jgi:probable HAF family extracellular repeat protein
VVGYAVAADGNQHAILWSAGTGVVDLGTSGTPSFATAINPSGTVIVGDTGAVFGQQGGACEWTKSGSTWTMSIICPPTTYAASLANAINSSGAIVGSCYDYPSTGFPTTTRDALYWPTGGAGSIVNLGQMGDTSAIATGINNSGVIVGYDSTIPFVDYNGTAAGMTNVTTLLAAGQGTGWTLQYCYGIDANGDIAARARYSGAYEAALLTPVPTPEPSTLLLAVGGLAGLLVCASRKRTQP